MIANGVQCTIQKDIDEAEVEKREEPFYDAVKGVTSDARYNKLMWRDITPLKWRLKVLLHVVSVCRIKKSLMVNARVAVNAWLKI